MSYYGYYDGHPSSKQMRYIKAIELYVDEEFTGDTMEEASEYIRRHERAYKEGRKKVDIKTKLAEKQQEEELLKKLLQDFCYSRMHKYLLICKPNCLQKLHS